MPRKRSAAGLAEAAPIFAALGDATRLRIVARLCERGPSSTVGLTEGTEVSRQAIAKHLRALEDAGLVRGGREGRERVWMVQPRRLAEVHRYLDHISEQWDEALGRLRLMVETRDH
jgi:DNA-binding transcriptional ArsR family regulator